MREPVASRVGAVAPGGPPAAARVVLTPAERARGERFARPDDAHRHLTARITLRALVGDRLGIDPATVVVGADERGRPVLPAEEGWWISVAHSGSICVCALARRPVGVDVEVVGAGAGDAWAVDDLLVRRTCTPAERRALDASDPPDREVALRRAWVRKEAVAKGLGLGLRVPFDHLDVRHDAVGGPGAAARWRVRDLDVGPGRGWRPVVGR